MANRLQLLHGGGVTRVDACGCPIPERPREGLVFEFRCRDCGCTRELTMRISRVNSRSFYVTLCGNARQRFALEEWGEWLEGWMVQGELKLVDWLQPGLRLVKG